MEMLPCPAIETMSPLSALATLGHGFETPAMLQRGPVPARNWKVPLVLLADAIPSGTMVERRVRIPRKIAFDHVRIIFPIRCPRTFDLKGLQEELAISIYL